MVLTSFSMTDLYSSNAFLAFAIGNTLYSSLSFTSYALCISNDSFEPLGLAMATISIAFRAVSVVMLWIIWLTKAGKKGAPSNLLNSHLGGWLPVFQAAYPIAISSALAFRLIVQMVLGDCHTQGIDDPLYSFCSPNYDQGGVSLRLAVELMFNPILTAFLLRDTRWEALFGAWLVAVAILVAYCAVVPSVDVIAATAAYVFCSVLIYLDSDRHHQELMDVLTQLQRATQDNERLAKEAQAIELRAMIGNVAHDLKTPLTSFLSGVECTLEVIASWDGPARSPSGANPALYQSRTRSNLNAMKKCLQSMKSTTAFMTMTINRCLDYTKTNAGVRLVPKLETVYLKALLEMPIKMMRDAQNHRDILLQPLDDDICSHIITDKQWLLENLLCLLSNAVKYSLKGEVEVSAELEQAQHAPFSHTLSLGRSRSPSDEFFIRFRVLDAGIGLSDQAMQGLFNPFKQAQRLAGGTGLGLFSLAKRIEALQGQYGVQRRPDGAQGSLFWFTIPYRPDTNSAALNSESSVNSSTIISLSDDGSLDPLNIDIGVPNSSGAVVDLGERKYSVLVVDDAPLIVRMTTMLLTRKGHTVKHAVNGAEALDLLLAGYGAVEGGSDNSSERTDSGKHGKSRGRGSSGGSGMGRDSSGSMSIVGNVGNIGRYHSGSVVHDASLPVGAPPFDVVLMDLQMPIMDGSLAMRRLRAAEDHFREEYREQAEAHLQQYPFAVLPHQTHTTNTKHHASTTTNTKHKHRTQQSDKTPHFRYGGEVKDPDLGHMEMGFMSPQSPLSPQGSELGLSGLFHQFIIAVSANSDEETVQDALHSGADTFMTKPFSYDTFKEMMEQAGK